MKLGRASVTHFGSYQDLTFDYSDLGIAMITGETGAGKSTLLDIPCWILWGIDSKGASVDEVRTWGVDEPTYGSQELTVGSLAMRVTRIRGEAKENDLYWTAGESDYKHRGKDMPETQRLLDERLGCDGDLYLLAAYLTQFNTTGDFFISTPKARRDTFERLVDLSLPVRLSDKASERRKTAKKTLDDLSVACANRRGQLEAEERGLAQAKKAHCDWGRLWGLDIANATKQSDGWAQAQVDRIIRLQSHSDAFKVDQDKRRDKLNARIVELKGKLRSDASFLRKLEASPICPTCLQSTTPTLNEERRRNEEILRDIKSLKDQLRAVTVEYNPHLPRIEQERSVVENPYTEKLTSLRAQTNPHVVDAAAVFSLRASVDADIVEERRLTLEISSLTRLHDLSLALRGELLRQVVIRLERQTNKYLEEYFDGELQVSFVLVSGDRLDVEIRKNGHVTTYRRLSGGQRCMLKLAYGIPRMAAAADRAGQPFELLAFDESLNGLSPAGKLKAYRLFEMLSTKHSSVLLIDHDATLGAMSSKEYKVTLAGDCSAIDTVDA